VTRRWSHWSIGERLAEPWAARTEYNEGWPHVLGRYVAHAPDSGPVADGDGEAWLVLSHTPGPALAEGSSVFAHADFGEHLAFLRRLLDEGLLVAAGPVDPDRGEGMALVRLKGAAAAAELARRAQDEDLSVARELLQVRVRPWRVALAG
jgi:uncharacterized protein YciI